MSIPTAIIIGALIVLLGPVLIYFLIVIFMLGFMAMAEAWAWLRNKKAGCGSSARLRPEVVGRGPDKALGVREAPSKPQGPRKAS